MKHTQELTKLKPCPFCGSEGKLTGNRPYTYKVTCQNTNLLCNVSLGRCFSKEEAISQWNTRAKDDLLDACIEARRFIHYSTGNIPIRGTEYLRVKEMLESAIAKAEPTE
jgi:Lar family restriction alleviation protein